MEFARYPIDVLCVGHAAFDLTLAVDHHPQADEKCSATGLVSCGGGPAANAAVTVSRLGGRSAFAGYLGDDHYGCLHQAELKREGVVLDWVARGSAPTPVSLVLAKPDGLRTVVNHKSRTPALSAGSIDFSLCFPKAILFDGHEPELSLELAETAAFRNIPILLDAGSVHDGTLRLLPYTDYLIASAKFARELTGRRDLERALEVLLKQSSCVAVTDGERGVIWEDAGGRGALPAFHVTAVDSTGAGDVFHGALALALVRGRSFTSAMGYASAAAALCCMKMGARPGIPTHRELAAFQKEYGSSPDPSKRSQR